MAVVGSINLLFKTSTDGLVAGVKKARSVIGGMVSGINSMNAAFVQLGINSASKAISSMASFAKSGLEVVDSVAEQASAIGTTTENLSRLQYATKLTGSDTEALGHALTKLTANLGSGAADDVLTKLGLDPKTLQAQDPTKTFTDIAEAISQLPTPAQKAAASMEIFGKGGVNILNTLNAGGDALAEMAAEADKLGVTINSADAKQIGAAQDAIDKLMAAWQGVANVLAAEVAPVLTALIEEFLNSASTSFDVRDIIVTGLEWIVKGFGVAADVVHTLGLAFKGAQTLITTGLAYVLDGISGLGKGLEWLLNKIPGVEVSFGTMLDDLAQGMHDLADKQFAELEEAFLADPPSVGIENWFNKVKAGAEQAAKAVTETTSALSAADLQTAELVGSIGELTNKLQDQIATFGMSSEEADIFRLAEAGASEEMLKGVKALQQQLKQLQENEKLKDTAKSLIESTRTPLEQYQEKLKEIQDLFDKGLIDATTAARAKQNAAKGVGQDRIQFAGLAELGSQKARDITLGQMFGTDRKDPLKESVDIQKQQLNRQDKLLTLLDKRLRPSNDPVLDFANTV